jgi:hypothetical protein
MITLISTTLLFRVWTTPLHFPAAAIVHQLLPLSRAPRGACAGLPPWLLNHWAASVWPISALFTFSRRWAKSSGQSALHLSLSLQHHGGVSLASSSRCYSTPLHSLRRTIAVLRQPEHDLIYTFLSSNIITDLSQGRQSIRHYYSSIGGPMRRLQR